LIIKSKYVIIKEKEKENMRKEQIEKLIVDLKALLEQNSGFMLGMEMLLENDFENERKQREYKKAIQLHDTLYNALIELNKALKGMD
jgi:oligoendopeptidase F